MIAVHNMSVRYPNAKNEVLHDISFEVKPGEIIGFLGPSGAGKSTLQKVLSGVLRTYAGSVRVFDTEVKGRAHSFYENIGVDFEFPNFYGKFTALENLNFFASLYSNKNKMSPVPLLERVGLLGEENKKVASYSKGMKMRLGFVRCLLHNPSLLFLDEPTSGLDPANARTIKDMILEQRQDGKTVILTTHNMHDAAELCDRVAFIVDGHIKAMDTPHALKKSGKDTIVKYTFVSDGKEIEKSGLLKELGNDDNFLAALENGVVTDIHSKEKTLEDVFIALTGRDLQ